MNSRCSRRLFLNRIAAGSAAYAFGDLVLGMPLQAASDAGVDPAAVLAFLDGVEKLGGMHSFQLLRGGRTAAEGWWKPYQRQSPHMLYSLSKSFTSTAIGFAVAEGRLTVDKRVTSFFPEIKPRQDENLRVMRVKDLLTMSTGHDKDATGPVTGAADGDWVKAFLNLPVEHAPGSKFVYNSAATFMLSAIIQQLTGETVLDYLRPRLFEPLGIKGATWENSPKGINTGGWGLSVKTEDIARFGQLYLQKGKWEGRQLIPASWVDEATSKQVSNGSNPDSDWNQGYGYQFWRCRHNAYRGDGAFGQYCVVMPDQDAVLAITSGLGDMQAVLNLVWQHLLPGMPTNGSAPSREASALLRRTGSLELPAPTGNRTTETAKRISGRKYEFEANDAKIKSVFVTFGTLGAALRIEDQTGKRNIIVGSESWARGEAPLGPLFLSSRPEKSKVAARGAWIDDNTFQVKLAYYETPYVETQTWKFDGDQVTVESKMNVGFGPTARPPLKGKAA